MKKIIQKLGGGIITLIFIIIVFLSIVIAGQVGREVAGKIFSSSSISESDIHKGIDRLEKKGELKKLTRIANSNDNNCGITYYQANKKRGSDMKVRYFHVGRFLGYVLNRDYGINLKDSGMGVMKYHIGYLFPQTHKKLLKTFTTAFVRKIENGDYCMEDIYQALPKEVSYAKSKVKTLIDK